MGRIHLTVAMDEIDTVRPLVDGSVRPDGIDLTVLTVGDATRHVRWICGFVPVPVPVPDPGGQPGAGTGGMIDPCAS